MRAPALVCIAACLLAAAPLASASLLIYDDAIQQDWFDESWPGGAVDFSSTGTVHSGTNAIKATIGWDGVGGGGVYLAQRCGLNGPDYVALRCEEGGRERERQREERKGCGW